MKSLMHFGGADRTRTLRSNVLRVAFSGCSSLQLIAVPRRIRLKIAGCTCDAGYRGTIHPAVTSPHYSGSCVPAAQCADLPYSTGTDVVSGCVCTAGASGGITVSTEWPFYIGSCSGVACPEFSTGLHLLHAGGCNCDTGYTGRITATTVAPFYTGSCVAVPVIVPPPEEPAPSVLSWIIIVAGTAVRDIHAVLPTMQPEPPCLDAVSFQESDNGVLCCRVVLLCRARGIRDASARTALADGGARSHSRGPREGAHQHRIAPVRCRTGRARARYT